MAFKINYSLKSSEIITFPFVPAYGIRHLKKAGWQNKVIGVIELFPVLGPIAALIERAVVAILQTKQNASKSNNLKKNVSCHIEKINAFKKNALNNFKKVQTTKIQEIIPAELVLKEEQEKALTKAVAELQKYHIPNNVKIHSRNGIWVFSINEIPNMIFKTTQSACDVRAQEIRTNF